MPEKNFKIAVVAGEASSDLLGASLINNLYQLDPSVEVIAVGGRKMASTAADLVQDNEVFSVMGLAEVLKDLPHLLRVKKQIVNKIVAFKPNVFIGIDSPDLNFSIAKSMKKHQISVIHYVSPSVWAWRPNRVFKMQKFIDYLLTLFPFEADIYKPTSITAEFVGHPLAQEIPVKIDKNAAKKNINSQKEKILAILPGSRNREIKTLMPVFAATIKKMNLSDKWGVFSSNVSAEKINQVNSIAAVYELEIEWVDDATDLLKAADFALLGSGTVALEAMLCKTPMVVAYQIASLTWLIVNTFKMMQLPYYSLPNVLYGDFLVPELMQKDLTVDRLTQACVEIINSSDQAELLKAFEQIHSSLLPEKTDLAAHKVMKFLKSTC